MARTTTATGVAVAVAVVLMLVGGPMLVADQSSLLRVNEVRQGAEAARVDDYLTRLVPHGFSGAVLVAAIPKGGN